MPVTCENWLGLVNSCVYYAQQTHEIYQVLASSWGALKSTEQDST